MKKISVLLLVVLPAIFVSAQTKKSKLANNLDSYFTALTNLKQFNGNVLVSENKKVLIDKTFNIYGAKGNLAASKQSKFIVASVSKAFVKVAILKLSEQGKLSLNDTVGKYIKGFPNGSKITVEQLLFHKSGLPRELANYENLNFISLAQAVELAKKEILLFEPSTQTAYSNVGYFLLHFIIDQVSGIGYFSFMQHELFDKLNLKNTFEYNKAKNKNYIINGFTTENDSIELTDNKTINQFETGNIITTVNDLYAFSQKIAYTNFLNSSSKTSFFQHDSTFMQAGGRKGYRAYLQINLKKQSTIILLSNQSNIPFDDILNETNNILNNKPFTLPHKRERKEIKLPVQTLGKYVGTYISNEQKLNFKLQLSDEQLVAIEPDNSKTRLFAETENSFFDSPQSKDTYTFLSNEKGEITTLQITTSGMIIRLAKQK